MPKLPIKKINFKKFLQSAQLLLCKDIPGRSAYRQKDGVKCELLYTRKTFFEWRLMRLESIQAIIFRRKVRTCDWEMPFLIYAEQHCEI
jgi:hypothetical protein